MHVLVMSPELFPVYKPFDRLVWASVEPTSGPNRRPQHYILTPRVVAYVRAHFNCSGMFGAPLEPRATGELGQHWSSAAFNDELMVAARGAVSVRSSLTLALLADSGWYNVNGSMAQPHAWGRNRGCGFVVPACSCGSQPSPPADCAWHDPYTTYACPAAGGSVRLPHVVHCRDPR
jgi:hypothetical protein